MQLGPLAGFQVVPSNRSTPNEPQLTSMVTSSWFSKVTRTWWSTSDDSNTIDTATSGASGPVMLSPQATRARNATAIANLIFGSSL